eukprot:gene14466-20482_t
MSVVSVPRICAFDVFALGALLLAFLSSSSLAHAHAHSPSANPGSEAACNSNEVGTCTNSPEDSPSHHQEHSSDGHPSDEQFIIRFNSYQLQETHQRQLEGKLGKSGSSWQWVPRHNKASSHPTDFGLVSSDWDMQEMKQRLEGLDFVKDVHFDKKILALKSWQPEGVLKDLILDPESTLSLAPVNDLLQLSGGEDSMLTELTPSIFRIDPLPRSSKRSAATRGGGHDSMQIGEEFGEGRGSKGVGQRSLKYAKTPVPEMMNAGPLWKAGFSGKGVKVGVFDTGINAGHPQIRNIKERTNWTHQQSLGDGLGHGSFVAGALN